MFWLLWWSHCGDATVVEPLWWSHCGGATVVESLWWIHCGGVTVVEPLWWTYIRELHGEGENSILFGLAFFFFCVAKLLVLCWSHCGELPLENFRESSLTSVLRKQKGFRRERS